MWLFTIGCFFGNAGPSTDAEARGGAVEFLLHDRSIERFK